MGDSFPDREWCFGRDRRSSDGGGIMMPSVANYATAQQAAQVVCHILVDELKLQSPDKFLLTEHGRFVWLLVVMDDLNLGGSMNKYVHETTVHRLSTALNGLPVYISNHSG